MSTRSGKRIHGSFHETSLKPNVEPVAESERKTRSRRMKENVEESSISLGKNKKRANYVSYPTTDEEIGTDIGDCKGDECKFSRLPRRNVLKVQNLITSSTESDELADVKKATRNTRRTRKFVEDATENIQKPHNVEEETTDSKKSKKGKKKVPDVEVMGEIISNKKSKKKGKKGRMSGSIIVEDIVPKNCNTSVLNKSSNSVDSFHSAAGSPLSDNAVDVPLDTITSPQKDVEINSTCDNNDDAPLSEGRQTRSATRLSTNMTPTTPNSVVKESRKRKSSVRDIESNDANLAEDGESSPPKTFKKVKKRKSNIKDTETMDDVETICDVEVKNSTFDLEPTEDKKSLQNATCDKVEIVEKMNTTYEKEQTEENSKLNTTFDKNDVQINTTFDKECANKTLASETERHNRKSIINTTFDKSLNDSEIKLTTNSSKRKSEILNGTFEKISDVKPDNIRRSTSLINTTFDKDPSEALKINKKPKKSISTSSQRLSTEMNSTFDKFEKPDSTFDKEKELDTTFDKISKSSIISSDNSTMDKSNVSRISITSDESKEIVNVTPVLIESSLDESAIMTKSSPKSPVHAPLTPLKREGTFTKDNQESVPAVEVIQPIPKVSRTPTKRMTLPSPGLTPFHLNKCSSKEKSMLNVTRSIEKSRRSSLAEPLPRATKVMFCSPVNNPMVVMQQRRKVIKSNLKGSNKSFVFEESGSTESRPARRKRSYTQNDADDAGAKRKRLQDGMQHSVDRLSRPRTFSATAKLAESTTPSKKPETPKKDAKISRTKLPNFAALHQKQFDKMESLDECQDRKAKRAKQLLTPTGAQSMLERISPKENTPDPPKSTNQKEKYQKKNKKTADKKPETPVKSLPTLKSLNPGYTRFGFKLNLDVNPFSVPSKNESKNNTFSFSSRKEAKAKLFTFSSKKEGKRDNTKPLKEIRANLSMALPSLVGTTSARKDLAKQTVMREKSFTDKRNVDRSENRTVIKGVRTNRRFELQMRMRNID